MSATASGEREFAERPGRLWSLWDMLQLGLGRLLDAHQLLVRERGNFERACEGLRANPDKQFWPVAPHDLKVLREAITDIEEVTEWAGLTCTHMAASRTGEVIDRLAERSNGEAALFHEEACRKFFHHLMDITSRLRDDAAIRLYYQIAPENEVLLDSTAEHFGEEVGRAFRGATEDIAEAAACLALERPTACVFHLMRSLEAVVMVIADKIGATVVNQHGIGLSWGQIASNMKPIIDKMPKGPDEQANWYKVHAALDSVGRAWRNPTAHPKTTYTLTEAKRVFDATRAFMQELAPLA